MLIVWIKRKKKDAGNDSGNGNKDAFSKHDEEMKRFRSLHQDMDSINAKDILTANGDVLAAVHGVKLSRHTQN